MKPRPQNSMSWYLSSKFPMSAAVLFMGVALPSPERVALRDTERRLKLYYIETLTSLQPLMVNSLKDLMSSINRFISRSLSLNPTKMYKPEG